MAYKECSSPAPFAPRPPLPRVRRTKHNRPQGENKQDYSSSEKTTHNHQQETSVCPLTSLWSSYCKIRSCEMALVALPLVCNVLRKWCQAGRENHIALEMGDTTARPLFPPSRINRHSLDTTIRLSPPSEKDGRVANALLGKPVLSASNTSQGRDRDPAPHLQIPILPSEEHFHKSPLQE